MKFQCSDGAVVELLPSLPYSACDPRSQHSLGVALQRQQGVHAIGTDRRSDFDTLPGTLAYTPQGIDIFSESQTGGEYLVVRWSADADVCFDAISPQRRQWHGHAFALRSAQQLRRHLLATAQDQLAIEQLVLELISFRKKNTTATSPQLRSTYTRVLDRISAEFDQPLTIAGLAAHEKKNPLLFLREFSSVMGMTPHAFIIEHRVQAARAMIKKGDMPLSLIAAACGFTHQSHMGMAFRKILGQTPGEYRMACSQTKQFVK
jgi:AraC-like DNA-binding protein